MKKYLDELEMELNKYKKDLKEMNEYMYNNPELGNEEYKSAKLYCDYLNKNGFNVTENYLNIPTAFEGKYGGIKPGPKIALLAEYDALPEIGHGCGHNILGLTSLGASLLLKKYIDEFGGELYLIGTPAEETNGAKVTMSDLGIFDKFTVAMIVHPTEKGHHRSTTSQAMEALKFKFKGKTAHAAGDPYNGINALDGVLNLFNSINALRQQTLDSSRIHGIISKGGTTPNVIPDYAEAKFYVRANKLKDMLELVEKVKNCGRGAALSSGTELEIENYEFSFHDMVTNKTLSEVYEKNIKIQGIEEIYEDEGLGSTDMGNVSHRCPAIHPYFPISKENLTGHSIDFAKASISEEAYKGMAEAIYGLVLTGIEILTNEKLVEKIQNEFKNKK